MVQLCMHLKDSREAALKFAGTESVDEASGKLQNLLEEHEGAVSDLLDMFYGRAEHTKKCGDMCSSPLHRPSATWCLSHTCRGFHGSMDCGCACTLYMYHPTGHVRGVTVQVELRKRTQSTEAN